MTDLKLPYNLGSINPIEEYAEVRSSKIHGLGLFAKKFIPKGTVWWYAREKDVMIISKDQFIMLDSSCKSPQMEEYMTVLLIYSYYEPDIDALIFCLDDSRYVNHSFTPNSGANEERSTFCSVAQCNIQIGEELTEDYSKYTVSNWLKKYNEFFDPNYW